MNFWDIMSYVYPGPIADTNNRWIDFEQARNLYSQLRRQSEGGTHGE